MDTATTGRHARSAATSAGKSATPASASPSQARAQSGTAGTAAGQAVSAKGLAYARSRGISPETLAKLGAKSGTASFADGKREALFWPYVMDGEVVNWTLAAGDYTLEIAKREDATLIDAILITDDLALDPATLP